MGEGPNSEQLESYRNSQRTPIQWGRWMCFLLATFVLIGVISGGFWWDSARKEVEQKSTAQKHLKWIGLALHTYFDMHGTLPAAGGAFIEEDIFSRRTKRGTVPRMHPGLSWRVALLPLLEQPLLYSEFHLNEPWNSPHNKNLIQKMPSVYKHPRTESPLGHTFYCGIVGTGLMARPYALKEITDPMSRTVLVIESDEPVVWTKPDEFRITRNRPVPPLGNHWRNETFAVLMADNAVLFLPREIGEKTIRDLADPIDGNKIPWDEIFPRR